MALLLSSGGSAQPHLARRPHGRGLSLDLGGGPVGGAGASQRLASPSHGAERSLRISLVQSPKAARSPSPRRRNSTLVHPVRGVPTPVRATGPQPCSALRRQSSCYAPLVAPAASWIPPPRRNGSLLADACSPAAAAVAAPVPAASWIPSPRNRRSLIADACQPAMAALQSQPAAAAQTPAAAAQQPAAAMQQPAAATIVGNLATASWSVEQTLQLTSEQEAPATTPCPWPGLLLECVASVSEAVDGLNAGLLACPGLGGGFCCVVRSSSKGAHFLLYQRSMREAALACLSRAAGLSAYPGAVGLPQGPCIAAADGATYAAVLRPRPGPAIDDAPPVDPEPPPLVMRHPPGPTLQPPPVLYGAEGKLRKARPSLEAAISITTRPD